jgi:hypothetical protein
MLMVVGGQRLYPLNVKRVQPVISNDSVNLKHGAFLKVAEKYWVEKLCGLWNKILL